MIQLVVEKQALRESLGDYLAPSTDLLQRLRLSGSSDCFALRCLEPPEGGIQKSDTR
jgi:hypothetical protein